MKKKEIRKALEGGTPFSSLYSLLPSGQKEKFKQFAAAFGFAAGQGKTAERNTITSH